MSKTLQTIYGTLDDKQLKELKGAVDEAINVMYEIDQKKRILKEIIDIASDNTKVPKKIISKIATVQHKQNLQEEVTAFKEFEALVETLTEIK